MGELLNGNYRRIYSGAVLGRRINDPRITAEIEVLFWRLNMIADDYGNFRADPIEIKVLAFPIRSSVQVENIYPWLQVLCETNLIQLYAADNNQFGHIVGFISLQPGGKNGKRIRRNPPCPTEGESSESRCIQGPKGESRCIQVNPVNPSAPEQEQNQNKNTNQNKMKNKNNPPATGHRGRGQGQQDSSLGDSDSDSKKLTRSQALNRWRLAVSKLWAAGPDKQRRGDDTSTTARFDELWPEGSDDDVGRERFAQAMKLIPQAAKAAKPMAALTNMLKEILNKD